MSNVNSIRPDGGTSLRALSEVRPVAHASTIGRASPKGGAGQRSNERMLKKTVSERKSCAIAVGWLETEWQEA